MIAIPNGPNGGNWFKDVILSRRLKRKEDVWKAELLLYKELALD